MTALDQAFIKAFARQNTFPLATSQRSATPKNVERRPRNDEQSTPVASRPPTNACIGVAATPIGQPDNPPATPRRLPLGVAVTLSQSASHATASVPTLESIWGSPDESSKTDVKPATPEEEDVPTIPMTAGVSQATVASEPWNLGNGQWSVDTGQWSVGAISWPEVGASSPAVGLSEPLELQPVAKESIAVAMEPPHEQPRASSAPSVEPCFSPAFEPAPVCELSSHEFKPAWQVDHFTWPRLCRRLISCAADELDHLADAILSVSGQGEKVLAIGGCHRGEGATTMLLCAARRLAERGIRLAMVDADLTRPRLAKRLGLQPQLGWDETRDDEEGRRIDEAMIEATANSLALLPAREPSDDPDRPAGDPTRLPTCLKALRERYDMVLVDLGPMEDAGLARGAWGRVTGNMIDGVVLVHNRRITSDEDEVAFEGELAVAGIAVAGIVENFVIGE
jgi:Mrp family chromosome partitioning ATPase